MATSKEYAYFIKGNKFAIVQKDFNFGDGLYYEDDGINDIGSTGALLWKSPIESITDGIEVEYVYSPEYRIENTSHVDTVTIDGDATEYYNSNDGLLRLHSDSNWDLAKDSPIVIKNSARWNGLHYVNAASGASKEVTLKTKYNGGSVFDSFTVYGDGNTNVTVMEDESFDLDVTRYQATQIVNYIKAKLSEDSGNIDLKEYFMREFRRGIEKHESGKKIGPYRTQGYSLFK